VIEGASFAVAIMTPLPSSASAGGGATGVVGVGAGAAGVAGAASVGGVGGAGVSVGVQAPKRPIVNALINATPKIIFIFIIYYPPWEK